MSKKNFPLSVVVSAMILILGGLAAWFVYTKLHPGLGWWK